MRIAVTGLDSSRPKRVAQHLAARGGISVLATDGRPVPADLAALLGSHGAVVDDLGAALGDIHVDVVLEFAHAADHRLERLGPILDAGIHVMCDKPLALTATDARELVALARANGVLLESDSGYRLAVDAEVRRHCGDVTRWEVQGPADPHAPEGGLAFYGIHHAQILDELLPLAGNAAPEVRRERDGIVASVDGVALRFLSDPRSVFALRRGPDSRTLLPPTDYLERLIDGFLARCRAGDTAVDERRIVRPIALMERIVASLAE